jgi:hypothetical protein
LDLILLVHCFFGNTQIPVAQMPYKNTNVHNMYIYVPTFSVSSAVFFKTCRPRQQNVTFLKKMNVAIGMHDFFLNVGTVLAMCNGKKNTFQFYLQKRSNAAFIMHVKTQSY